MAIEGDPSKQHLSETREYLQQGDVRFLWRYFDIQEALSANGLTLTKELQAQFQKDGYGSFVTERQGRVAFITYAHDSDIESFRYAQLMYRWGLIKMPTAPLIQFYGNLLDHPGLPYILELLLNVGDPEQTRLLYRLVEQKELAFDFFGKKWNYRYSNYFGHPAVVREGLQQIIGQAIDYWHALPPGERDFGRAKLAFLHR